MESKTYKPRKPIKTNKLKNIQQLIRTYQRAKYIRQIAVRQRDNNKTSCTVTSCCYGTLKTDLEVYYTDLTNS
jgi:hypothetical protein